MVFGGWLMKGGLSQGDLEDGGGLKSINSFQKKWPKSA